MAQIRKFLFIGFAWILFGLGGFFFLLHEMEYKTTSFTSVQLVENASYEETPDLTKMTGEQVIGLIPAALSGEYVLIIDQVMIDQYTDIELVNLSSVPNFIYKISITRSQDNVSIITATH